MLKVNRKYIPKALFTKEVTKKKAIVGLITVCIKRGIFVARFERTRIQ